MRIEFTLDAWKVLMGGRASGNLPEAGPHLLSGRPVGTGIDVRYVVECPEAVAHELQDFFRAHAQPGVEGRQGEPGTSREHASSVQGLDAVQRALGCPDAAAS